MRPVEEFPTRRTTRRSVLLILTAAALAIAAPRAAGQERPATQLAIAYGAVNANVAPIWVARDQAFFAKHGLAPEASFLIAGRAAQAMLAGEVQVALMGPTHVVNAVAAGGDLVILMGLNNRIDYLLIAKRDVRTAADLKGKTLGVGTPSGAASLAMHLALDRFGLEPGRDRITLVNAGGEPERLAAFLAGSIDATVLAPEILEKLEGHAYTVLLDLGKVGVPWQHTAVVVRRAFLRERPGVVEATLKALLEATAFIHRPADKPAVLKTLARELRLSTDRQAEVAYRELVETLPRKPYPTQEGIASAIQLLTRLKLNPKAAQVTVDQVVDTEPLRRLEPFMEALGR